MTKFTQFHLHTENSLFDGISKVEEIIKKCKKEKMESVAVTDHHNVYAWFQLNKLSKMYKMKPIYGIELNVEKHHLTAIAVNNDGLNNLSLLNNIAYLKKNGIKVGEKDLFKHKGGIHVMSGCLKGKIPSFLLNNSYEDAYQIALKYKEVFGEDFSLEIQSYQFHKNKELVKQMIKLSKELRIKVIPTNDCHYLERGEARNHHRLVSMNTNGKSRPTNTENYLKTEAEMKKFYPEYVMENAKNLTDLVKTDFDSFAANIKGEKEMPISMMYYLTDAESIRKALYAKKKYALAEFLYKKITRDKLTLETLYYDSELAEDVEFAYSLRNRLYKIEPDPYYYIKVNDCFPVWRKAKEGTHCAQIDIFMAKELGFEIYDRRKEKTS